MKKALKKTGKIIGIVIASILGFLAVLCIITLCWGFVQQTRGQVSDGLPTVSEDFVPELRLVIFTDTHNQNENVADAVDTAYALFDNDETYKGIDAFYCLGDFSSVGFEGDYTAYAQTIKEHVREETPCITIHGNHEFKQKEYKEYFANNFDFEPNNVREINGFSCIAFSGDPSLTEWTFTPSSLKWLSDSIEQAEKTADGKPIFVFQHPHPWGTVYGSSVWGDPQINVVLNGHTSVVDFSGHSHYPFSDPRSINQASYTAVGCGAMATFELDKDGIVNQHPDGYDKAAEICIVEADSDGSVRLRGYDLNSDTYFCDYYIDNVNDKASFPYTYKNMRANDKSPVFKEDTKASAKRNEEGEWVLSFDEAVPAEGFIVHEYKITIKDESGKKVFSKNLIDDYYVYDDDNTADFRIGKDTLKEGGKYTLSIKAESAYHYYSKPIELSFTAE